MTDRSDFAAPRAGSRDIEQGDRFAPLFDDNGLLPAICVDATDGSVLMFAWMNRDAVSLTLSSGYAHFWSRSRSRIWQKGEESGNRLRVREALTDCDQDVLLLKVEVEGNGVACHTGARSCFYRRLDIGPDAGRPVPLERADEI